MISFLKYKCSEISYQMNLYQVKKIKYHVSDEKIYQFEP